MDIPLIFFLIICLFIFIIFIYQFWYEKGRVQTIEMMTGLKTVGEPLDLPLNQFTPRFGIRVKQELRVYKCREEDNIVFIIENTQKTFGSISRTFVKLSADSIDKLNSFKSDNTGLHER